jgi:hypothetical protein
MKKPSAAHTDAARRLVAQEANGAQSIEEHAAAAERVHARIFARLASLLGATGTRALFTRSVRLTLSNYPRLRNVSFDAKPNEGPMEPLAAYLREEDPAIAVETAVALCAALLTLLSTLIGERLTFQVLRSAWPDFDASAPPKEETK